MTENLRPREGVNRLLAASATLMTATALVLFVAEATSGAAVTASRASSRARRPGPAPARFLAGAANTRAGTTPDGDHTRRLLSALLFGQGGPAPESASTPLAEAAYSPGADDRPAQKEGPVERALPQAEVVARVERSDSTDDDGGHWVVRTEPFGRLYHVSEVGADGRSHPAAPQKQLVPRISREATGRIVLETARGRFRVVDPPWRIRGVQRRQSRSADRGGKERPR
jgi:hypothetical protein